MENRISLNERIAAIERENRKGIDLAQKMSKDEHLQMHSTRELEDQKFEEFKEIVKDEMYFRLDHVKKLGIDYDILIHLSAKNAGKTTHIYRCIDECIKKGEKFIYGRVMENELKGEIIKFQEDKDSSVEILEDKGRYYFYKKDDILELKTKAIAEGKKGMVTPKILESNGYDYVGLGMIFMSSNTLGGGKYENFTTLFFDEIVSYQPKKYINDNVMYNWGCAVSTILRNKKSLHIIMMGNLKPEEYIPVLDYYNIDVSDDLRIVRRVVKEGTDPCTILYINSGCLYKATLANQARVAHHAKLEDRLFQARNKLTYPTDKVIGRRLFEEMQYVYAFAVFIQDTFLVFHVRQTDDKENPKMCLSVDQLTITTYIDGPIYVSMESKIKSKFGFTQLVMDVNNLIEHTNMMIETDWIYFDSIKSLNLTLEFMGDLVRKYVDRGK